MVRLIILKTFDVNESRERMARLRTFGFIFRQRWDPPFPTPWKDLPSRCCKISRPGCSSCWNRLADIHLHQDRILIYVNLNRISLILPDRVKDNPSQYPSLSPACFNTILTSSGCWSSTNHWNGGTVSILPQILHSQIDISFPAII
jgi:hypothetical protein